MSSAMAITTVISLSIPLKTFSDGQIPDYHIYNLWECEIPFLCTILLHQPDFDDILSRFFLV